MATLPYVYHLLVVLTEWDEYCSRSDRQRNGNHFPIWLEKSWVRSVFLMCGTHNSYSTPFYSYLALYKETPSTFLQIGSLQCPMSHEQHIQYSEWSHPNQAFTSKWLRLWKNSKASCSLALFIFARVKNEKETMTFFNLNLIRVTTRKWASNTSSDEKVNIRL